MFEPDVESLKRKLENGFDFTKVTRELLKTNHETDGATRRSRGIESEITAREARILVRKIESLAYGR